MSRLRYSFTHKAVAFVLPLLFLLLFFPVTAKAEGALHSVTIDVSLLPDGSAEFTEVWDVTTADGTEFYIPKHNLDGRVISNFTVTDETGAQFTDVGDWDSDQSRAQKAGKSGLLQTNGGYELCWGFGTYGEHTYTLRYTMTELVRGYEEADALYQYLVPKDLMAPLQSLKITIAAPGQTLTSENTRVWAFGFSVDFGVSNGTVNFASNRALYTSEYAVALIRFEKGMFSPSRTEDGTFEDIKAEAMIGSNYPTEEDTGGGGQYEGGGGEQDGASGSSGGNFFSDIFDAFGWLLPIGIIMFIFGAASSAAKSKKKNRGGAKAYRDVEYSRNLPYGGSLPATYTRLDELGALKNDGDIIGAYILRWVRSHQVEILPGPSPGKEDSTSIKLYTARPEMDTIERGLYEMLVSASGPDWVLQNKEFKKWSKKNYTKVESWYEQCENSGSQVIRSLGGLAQEEAKVFFGLLTTTKTVVTPVGEQLTREMFGFKKYLEDFTIINERQAREVQLWDDYLVFAQLFGVADTVAQQFKALYPAYFAPVDPATGARGPDMFDIYMVTRIANSYGRSMSSGYHAGATAASLASGGGGSYSGGGGSGGGGSSSGGGTR